MMHWMTTLSNSKDAAMTIVAALAVITVVGLEFFRKRLGHMPRDDNGARGNAVVAVVGIVFLAKLVLGGAGMAAEVKNFLDLSLVLFGVSGIAIISTFMWRYHRGLPLTDDDDEERRRMLAHDL